jgi:2-polyprenyl-3-methyl-5-hydroxy-6-metoxy-1,4-benzoquinol methylase
MNQNSRSYSSMTAGQADQFDAGERVYVGKTSRNSTVQEHIARYEFALGQISEGGLVVDAACGSGFGSQMLARRARHVVGLDVSESAVNYAARNHWSSQLSYLRADLTRGLPLQSASVDHIVSFETIEHVPNPERLVSEYARVLKRGGQLILSTPDRVVYSELSGYSNPFHRAELSRREFIDLVSVYYKVEAIYGQLPWSGSVWRRRIELAIRRRLPPPILAVAKNATRAMRQLVAPNSAVRSDVSIQRIRGQHSQLFYFLVIVARKP